MLYINTLSSLAFPGKCRGQVPLSIVRGCPLRKAELRLQSGQKYQGLTDSRSSSQMLKSLLLDLLTFLGEGLLAEPRSRAEGTGLNVSLPITPWMLSRQCVLYHSLYIVSQLNSKLLEGGNETSHFSWYPSFWPPVSTAVPDPCTFFRKSLSWNSRAPKLVCVLILPVLLPTRIYSSVVMAGLGGWDDVSS